MTTRRLSYETAGAAPLQRGEVAPNPRATPLARAPSGLAAPLRHGHSAAHRRRRRMGAVTMLVVHAVAIVGLLNASRLRGVVVDAKPMFLAVVDAPAPITPSKPLPLPPGAKVPPPPPLTLPILALDQAPAPAPVVAQVLPQPPAVPVASVELPPAPAPAIAPKTIPPSAVQYLVPPTPVYSRISARMRESGKALVRVYIDEVGMPRSVQLAMSTGFARLDDAALAAVRNCRFRPYVENGVPVAAWAAIPIEFELPK